jgi:hypothetical protein
MRVGAVELVGGWYTGSKTKERKVRSNRDSEELNEAGGDRNNSEARCHKPFVAERALTHVDATCLASFTSLKHVKDLTSYGIMCQISTAPVTRHLTSRTTFS